MRITDNWDWGAMGRVTDGERREAARRLRGNPDDTLIPHKTGRHHGMGRNEAADRFWDMCDRIKAAGDYDIAFSTTSVLADLIEPQQERTCNMFVLPKNEQLWADSTAYECSVCGHVNLDPVIDGYCRWCGAKVMQNAFEDDSKIDSKTDIIFRSFPDFLREYMGDDDQW